MADAPVLRKTRTFFGCHTLYGVYPDDIVQNSLAFYGKQCRVVDQAIFSSRKFLDDNSFDGAVYDENGRVVPDSIRQSRTSKFKHNCLPEVDRESFSDVEELAGTSIYLGSMMGGFGHFLLELLSRFWIFDVPLVRASRPRLVFHGWKSWNGRIDRHVMDALNTVAGPDPDIFVSKEAHRFETLLVPNALFSINEAGDPLFGAWCERFAAVVTADLPPRAPAEKIYVSRTRLPNGRRRIVGEERLEDYFRAKGFEIIYPETLGFAEQVQLMMGCRILAGCDGSAMHQALFMPSGRTVVCFDGRFVRNQHAIDLLKRHNAHHFRCLNVGAEKMLELKPSRFAQIRTVLDEILAEAPEAAGATALWWRARSPATESPASRTATDRRS